MIKIIIADDQLLFLQGLHVLLKDDKEIRIIGEARNGREVIDLVMKEKPDVVITDIQMPEMDGVELTQILHESYPEIGIIGLTIYEDEHLIVDMLEAGAKGYLLKTTTKEQLVEAIKVVQGHGYYYCNDTSLKVLNKIAKSKMPECKLPEGVKFSSTELKIIHFIIEQLSSKEIGDRLNLGKATVEGYRHKIYQKMGVKNMAGMVVNAIRWGMVDVPVGTSVR